MKFSIIIPLYNEEKRLVKSAGQIFDFFSSRASDVEIIFVNDGSTDKTKLILEQLATDNIFKVVSYGVNHGKGYAVKQGALSAVGENVVFFDVDLATPLVEFDRLVSFLEDSDQIVVGSRRLQSSSVNKSESRLRTYLGVGFTKLSNLFVPGISDFTCGFKCFSNNAVRIIFPLAKIERWSFDTELLYIAKLNNLKIREMPVSWSHDSDSRVRVGTAVLSSFRDLVKIKINQIMGMYDIDKL